METRSPRAVLDTNIFLSAFLSKNTRSPAKELIVRLGNEEFILLISDAIFYEIIEKLVKRKIARKEIIDFVALIDRLAEWVEVPKEAVKSIIRDPDDDHILACAVIGHANYLVTHDKDFESLGGQYQSIKIVPTLPFLWYVRGDTPPC